MIMRNPLVIFAGILLLFQVACENPSAKQHANQEVKDSIEMLTNQIRSDSTNYELFLNRAQVYLNRGTVNPVLRDISRALELNREDPRVYNLLSDVYFIIGKPEDAIGAIKKAMELAPDQLAYVVKLARTYIMLRRYDAAYRYIEQALSMDFQHAESYYLKGIYLL